MKAATHAWTTRQKTKDEILMQSYRRVENYFKLLKGSVKENSLDKS